MGVEPDWQVDAFMKAMVREGKRENISTDLALHYLGLDVCPDFLPTASVQLVQGGLLESSLADKVVERHPHKLVRLVV